MNNRHIISRISIVFFASIVCSPAITAQDSYYTEEPAFTPFPQSNPRKGGWLIQNFGPVGIGITLEKGMVMKIKNVEKGSPAERTGKLKAGQIITSINGVQLDGKDPRLVLGQIITEAEASDGRINLMIKDLGNVTANIPVMGRYSDTWPLNCQKSDKIVRNLADRLAEEGKKDDWGAILFLLSTGEERDLQVVRSWIKGIKTFSNINWSVGYRGIGFCEYYLRTGDASVLPAIQEGAEQLRDTIYNGGWSGRTANFTYQSGGHLNAAGVHCLTFLLLAKTCGVDVDEATLQNGLRHFYRYSGRGSVPYGDYTPKVGFSDCNGKTSGLALAMAAASRLTPNGDQSIYAQAAQVNAMKAYYGINVYGTGHTGGGIGEIWKSASMGLMQDKRPQQYRQYIDARRWILELSRRHNGGIGIAGGMEGNYDKATGEHRIPWGNYFALNYTLPRKQLYLFGAESEYAKKYPLPERPWGTAADDAFSSPYPVSSGPWSRNDIFKETTEEHAGQPVYKLLRDDKVSNQTIVTYLHHPEITHRSEAMKAVLRLKKDDMLLGLLQSGDARLRQMGVMALHEIFGTWRRDFKDPKRVTSAMWDQVEKIIRDPHESWFVKQWAVGLLRHAELERLRTFKDLLAVLVEHEEQWVHGAAITASIPLLMDVQSYRQLFPPISRTISKTTSYPIISRAHAITAELGSAEPEIQSYGLEIMKKVYQLQPEQLMSERGIYEIPGGAAVKRKAIGQVVGFSEAGQSFLNAQPKVTSKWVISGSKNDLYTYSGQFEKNPVLTGRWALVGHQKLANEKEAIAFVETQVQNGKIPPKQKNYKGYGFSISNDGGIGPLGLIVQNYTFPMRYSGNMAFCSFIDKAYHLETFSVGGRDFMMFEVDFESERNKNYKPSYKTYTRVQP